MEIELHCSSVCRVRVGGRTGESAGSRGICLLLLMLLIALLVNVATYYTDDLYTFLLIIIIILSDRMHTFFVSVKETESHFG